MKEFRLASLSHFSEKTPSYPLFSESAAKNIRAFHKSFPMYAETPLANLSETAKALGLGSIYVKDESHRFGLNAFKVLGGSYAIGSAIAEKTGLDISGMTYEALTDPRVKETLGDITFVTATDGNHGRGVAWAANAFGFKSVVYMPKGTVSERLENIRKLGSDASITDFTYDECVRLANKNAKENGWIVVQDTAWEGYEEIPSRIMQGYTTMALEAHEQLPEKPTHIFLQAGVGSMAAAVAAFFANIYKEDRPVITIVEPCSADCFYKTAEANDGKRRFAEGEMHTIMAGLACGEPCTLAWDILSKIGDHFIAFPDYAAAQGMRILGNPMKGDDRVISGESGASAFGCVSEILTDPALSDIKKALKLDDASVCLFFSTEGDTDRENYRRIVWNGAHSPMR